MCDEYEISHKQNNKKAELVDKLAEFCYGEDDEGDDEGEDDSSD